MFIVLIAGCILRAITVVILIQRGKKCIIAEKKGDFDPQENPASVRIIHRRGLHKRSRRVSVGNIDIL